MSNEIATIDFHGEEIVAYKDEETGKIQVNVRRTCESIGVNFTGQMRKLKSNPVYEKGLAYRDMSTNYGEKKSWFIDSTKLQSWLTTIQVARVKPELREKLLAFQLEAAKALHDHFTKGFSVNEQAFGQAPDIVINGLVAKIDELSSKLDNRSTVPTDEIVERRMKAMSRIFDVLGKPDEVIVSTLRDQMLVQLTGGPPAPTLADQGIFYVSDYWRKEKSGKRLTNVGYDSDKVLFSVLGRHSSRYSRKHNLPIRPTNTVYDAGRIGNSNMYIAEAIDYAIQRTISEGKVIQQLDTGYL